MVRDGSFFSPDDYSWFDLIERLAYKTDSFLADWAVEITSLLFDRSNGTNVIVAALVFKHQSMAQASIYLL